MLIKQHLILRLSCSKRQQWVYSALKLGWIENLLENVHEIKVTPITLWKQWSLEKKQVDAYCIRWNQSTALYASWDFNKSSQLPFRISKRLASSSSRTTISCPRLYLKGLPNKNHKKLYVTRKSISGATKLLLEICRYF